MKKYLFYSLLGFIVCGTAGLSLVSAYGHGPFAKNIDEWKGLTPEERQEKMAESRIEMQAQMEEWQNMSEEERQAKMEEMRAGRPFDGHFGFMGMRGFNLEDVDFQVVNIDNGVQITITSDNADVVQKIQEMASKIPN